MVCRVCKRELTDPICSFCGEDNTAYMQDEPVKVQNPEPEAEIGAELQENTRKKHNVKSKYKLNKKKLFKLILVLACIIILIAGAVKLFAGDDEGSFPEVKNPLFSSGMLAVSTDGEWGYINKDEPSIFAIAPQFSHVTDFHADRGAVCIDGKFSLIDKNGKLICEPTFDSVGEFSENGFIAVKKDGKWGYVDKNANYIIEPKFITASGFSANKTAVVSVSGSFGFIGEDGEYIVAPQYEMALSFKEGSLAPVKTSGKWGYIDKSGAAVIEPQFEEAFPFENGLAVIKKYGSYGLIDAEGNIAVEPQFDERFYFTGDTAIVNIGGKYGLIDKTGEFVISPRFKALGNFSKEGIAPAQRGDGVWGYADINGEFIISAHFEDAKGFRCSLAPVKKDGFWGYIDKDGNMVIEAKYPNATEFFDEGFACVENVDGSFKIIDTEGKVAMVEAAGNITAILK